ncbi:ribosome biogenesis protein WDR12 homolog [Diaphorina citri]|uniref:Ribosome biogenesis protein WDR12 homolog n=1 Tax=Diaphorina citri TaxID=121845 RepID=A0A1S3CW14_DIACI|nr:ribosome biogenesis protein WDR12 homolog [Diaphorina citri]
MAEEENTVETSDVPSEVQLKFFTKQEKYAVPDLVFAVQGNLGVPGLNSLINEILKEDSNEDNYKDIQFDFLIAGELLRTSVTSFLESKGISSENVIDVEYLESTPTPSPLDCILHDDWVSAIDFHNDWILTGCYDHSVHIWTRRGEHKLNIPGHGGPVKGVAWLYNDGKDAAFISVSTDQTAMIWEWKVESNSIECIHVCRGHERGLETVTVSESRQQFATGGWDCLLKIWSADISKERGDPSENGDEGTTSKKRKKEYSSASSRTPLITLKGHKEAISAVQWTAVDEIITSSWDHTLKIWDAELGGMKSEIVGNKSFFDVHYSPLSKLVITASADKQIRLYDPKVKEGAIVKSTFSSHKEWVQSVRWSPIDPQLFVSASFDNSVKLWDLRR